MPIVIKEAIFLGNYAEANTIETSMSQQNESVFLGTFGAPADPLSDRQFDIAYDDVDADDRIFSDNAEMLFSDLNFVSDQISYDVGSGPQVAKIDALVEVEVTATYPTGTTLNFSDIRIFQDTNGNLFLLNAKAGQDLNDGGPLQSITVSSVTNTLLSTRMSNMQEFVCFSSGTLIATPAGPRRVEALVPGDLVETLDAGPRPLVWVGARTLDFTACANPKQKPIEIKPGAFGPDLPSRPLIVSPQHRVLVNDRQGQERLAKARALLPALGIRRMGGRRQVTYHSLMLQRHHVLFAEDLAVESFYPGPYAMRLLSSADRLSIIALCPGLLKDPQQGYGPHARPLLTRAEGEALARQNPAGLGLSARRSWAMQSCVAAQALTASA